MIIACTSESINENELLDNLINFGFDNGLEQPLTTSIVKDVIESMLKDRDDVIQNRIRTTNMINYSNDNSQSMFVDSALRRGESLVIGKFYNSKGKSSVDLNGQNLRS